MGNASFAQAAQAARRGHRMSMPELAAASRVREEVVRWIEAGERVTERDAALVCMALSLPMATQMPRLPRSADLSEAARAISEHVTASACRVPGRSYVVREASRLDRTVQRALP